MRLFVAIDIEQQIRERMVRFMEGLRGFAPDVRWVDPGSLHLTLKFIGEMPESELGKIKGSLRSVHGEPCEIHFRGYGFFPSAKSPRVFWIGIESGPQLSALAAETDSALVKLGVPREEHAFTPHLTLARRRGGSGSPRRSRDDGPNAAFQIVQKQLTAMASPDFGTMSAKEFFLYQSQLSPKGSKYTKLERFALA